MAEYSPELAEEICVQIAAGDTMEEVSKREGMPSRPTVYRWLAKYPKFFDAYERAKEVSAQSLEEEALTMARHLAGMNDFTSTKVAAYRVAMEQLRWSAARRDKARFGQQIPTTATVPIQINTTLNLDPTAIVKDTEKSMFHIDLQAINSAADSLNAQAAIEASDEIGDNPFAFDVPIKPANELKPRQPRRKPGHKDAGQALATARRYANQEKKRLAKKE